MKHTMTALSATIRKELLLLLRDIHGLLLLFLMPVLFILVMSLALQNQFAERAGSKIDVLVDDQAQDAASATVLQHLLQGQGFHWVTQAGGDVAAKRARIRHDEYAFLLTLRHEGEALHADILVAPATGKPAEVIFTATVREALMRQRIGALMDFAQQQAGATPGDDGVQVQYSYQKAAGKPPTSVQQSVPAWLVFAMFFSVVPLSNALIGERQQGTLRRLRTLPVSPFLPIIGKLIPYFVINQLQVVLMVAVGIWLVPLCGGDRLAPGDSWGGLALMASAVSIAALGYGMLIAVLARTTDQATTLGGTGNIILGAIGGIMVPRFVMPEGMQHLAQASPMSWGLEGFLDIFLRNGGIAEVLPEAGALFAFGCVTIALALAVSLRKYQ